ncbi:hypothetical protein [Ottowia sp.]|uniref:hypothetical protein n=1 Tax=Ottowia sp. TaxID=1898956 RepID=UPI0025F6ADD3|nr:hypothetical protein [Ottowia sp.]MBK6616508.1 hypothetical protein [Ottowia sp.]
MTPLRRALATIALCAVGAAVAKEPVIQEAEQGLWCVPLERLECGCSLVVDDAPKCPNQVATRQPHFFVALMESAPLWVSIGGRLQALNATPGNRKNEGVRERGRTWTDRYVGAGGLAVEVTFRPGNNSCPREKIELDEGCEFFDVAATVRVTGGSSPIVGTYLATGTCGC